jgi:pseudouridine synthase
MGFRVPKGAKVAVDGKVLSRSLSTATYLLYKPDLCLTSRADPQGRTTIFELPDVKKLPANVQAVGRLDFRSEGLLILTNDGDLAFALTHPRFSVEKKYAVLVADLVAPDELEKLRRGVVLEDGLARAVSVRAGGKENMGAGKKGQWVEVVVTEGRNRLIRRMMEHLGHKVNRLVRVAIGELTLPTTLKPGAVISIQGKDLAALNRVRDEFLKNQSEAAEVKKHRNPGARRKGMSDEMYAEERVRRSQETAKRAAARTEKQKRVGNQPKPKLTGLSLVKPGRSSKDTKPAKPSRSKPATPRNAPRGNNKSPRK